MKQTYRLAGMRSVRTAMAGLLVAAWAGVGVAQERVVELPEYAVRGILPHPLEGMGGERFRSGLGDFVPVEDLDGRHVQSAADWLGGLPGVFTAEAFGGNDLPKLSLRGSDLAAFPTKKGVLLLRDDLPLNQADGSLILAIAGTQALGAEVTLGHAPGALVLPTLGGTVNLVSPTGRSAPGGSFGTVLGGFGRMAAEGSWGGSDGTADLHVHAGHRRADGYRLHNTQEGTWVAANAGRQFGSGWLARAYVQAAQFAFDVPGPLNPAQAGADPRGVSEGLVPGVNAGANTLRDRPRRDGEYLRAGLRLGRFAAGEGGTVIGLQGSWLDDTFVRPIALGIEESEYANAAASVLHEVQLSGAELPLRLQFSGVVIQGRRDAAWFHNADGDPGPEFARFRLPATTAAAGLSFAADVPTATTLEAGLVYAYARRTIQERFADPDQRPGFGGPPPPPAPPAFWGAAVDGRWSYDAWLPTVALKQRIGDVAEVHVRAYRSWEAPVFDDLLDFFGGSPNRGPTALSAHGLRAQRDRTVEGGVRYQQGGYAVALVAYESRLRDEILTLSDGGALRRSLNAGRTRHRGAELTLQAETAIGAAAGAAAEAPARLRLRLMGEATDYRFVDDPIYGRNRLPGIPEHRVRAEAMLRHRTGWFAALEGEWRSSRTYMDFANTGWLPNVALAHARIGTRRPQGVSWFVEARNLFNTNHASTSIIVEQLADPIATSMFPGEARNLRAGVEVRW